MRKILLAGIAAIILMPVTGETQSTRYSTWSDPNNPSAGQTSELQDFKARLNKLIDEAEKARAADPVFLRDLRALANGTTSAYTTTVLDDAFTDGNFTANPTWQVISGEYFVEKGWGLRNRIITKQAQSNTQSGDDLAKVLLGTIIKRAAGVEDQQGPVENAIITKAAIPNAFAVTTELWSAEAGGHFEIGVFQGQDAKLGYRLLYAGGKGIQLHRVGSSGSSMIKSSANAIAIEDKKFHTVRWTRAKDGTMSVTLDGNEILNVVDRGFSDPFDGLRFSNREGDFIVKQVTVKG